MPDKDIVVDDSQISYGLFHNKTKFKEGAELFPSGGKPSPLDIKQGYTDLDCYLLSVLSSLASTREGQSLIFDCFPEYKLVVDEQDVSKRVDWFKNKAKIKVSFFKFDGSKEKLNITVDKSALRKKGVPWVRLLEKAFAVYKTKYMKGEYFDKLREQYKKSGRIKSRVIDGSKGPDSASAFCAAAFTGEKYEFTDEYPFHGVDRGQLKKFSSGPYSSEVSQVYENIKSATNFHKVVTAGASRGIKIYSKGLFLMHTYTILGVEEKGGKKYVIVRNPYAGRSRVYEKKRDGKMHSKVVTPDREEDKGVSKLELNDFCKYFDSYTIGAKQYIIGD